MLSWQSAKTNSSSEAERTVKVIEKINSLMRMAPRKSPPDHISSASSIKSAPGGYLLDRDLNSAPDEAESSKGNYMQLSNGRMIFDASGGAAVACLGHGNREVLEAVKEQMDQVTYCHSATFRPPCIDSLAADLIAGTDMRLDKAFILCSGSEVMEASIKLSRQYYVEIGQPQRFKFIAREHSYHGATMGALSMSGHVGRRAAYIPLLSPHIYRVSSCNPYRQRLQGETDANFVARKATELDQKFRDLGPDTVIGFVCEPVSGASLGCVPYVPGYLAAMKAVCTKYDALFILDEVMCGMGRTGTLHAWQAEHSDEPGHDCVPDIQTIGKGLGGGYQAVSGVLIGHKIVKGLKNGSGAFLHGQTFQAYAPACAAALAVQRIIKRDHLLANVRRQGAHLALLLHEKLDSHLHVGDIRGIGLFWGIEFVKDKKSKEPFDAKLNIAKRIDKTGLSTEWSMTFYPGQGTADGLSGDHVIIAPAYNVTSRDVELIVKTIEGIIREVFDKLEQDQWLWPNGTKELRIKSKL